MDPSRKRCLTELLADELSRSDVVSDRAEECGAGSSLRFSVGQPPHGRSRRVRSRVNRFAVRCSNWDGPSAVTCGIDYRWPASDAARGRQYAAEIVALAPEVILASGSSVLAPLLQATRILPIVFTVVSDPVAGGFVDSLARPGGNATGFTGRCFHDFGRQSTHKSVPSPLAAVGVVATRELVQSGDCQTFDRGRPRGRQHDGLQFSFQRCR